MHELASKATTLVPHEGRPRVGTLTVTADELVFTGEDGGPLAVIPRSAIYAVVNERRLLHRDRMRIKTAAGDLLFNDGYRDLGRLLRGVDAIAGAYA
jgi:hypothetical protein